MGPELPYEKSFPAGDDFASCFENPFRLSWSPPWVLLDFIPALPKGYLFPTELGTSLSAYLCTEAPLCFLRWSAQKKQLFVQTNNSAGLSWRINKILNNFDYSSVK